MKRFRLFITISSFVIFLFITITYRYAWMIHIDEVVMKLVAQTANIPLTIIFKGFTHLGSYYGTVIVGFFVCVIFFFKQLEREIVPLVLIVMITPIVNLSLKVLFQRPRPSVESLLEISGYSFPSGHTMYAMSLYGMILVLLWPYVRRTWKRALLLVGSIVMISMIALSRIYLRVHFLTDVIGGVAMSIFLITITLKVYDFYISKHSTR